MTAWDIILLILIVILGVAVIIASVAALVYRSYKKLIRKKETDFSVMNLLSSSGGILFLGDSLTDFYPVSEFFPCKNIYNRGVAGNTTLDVLNRLDDCLQLKPKKLFLQIGINDLIYYGPKNATTEKVADRIISIAESFRDCEVFVLSLYPINKKRHTISPIILRHCTTDRIIAVNERLRALCEEKNFTFIDIYPLLTDERGVLDDRYGIEGLHLTMEGYEVVTRKLKEFIQ